MQLETIIRTLRLSGVSCGFSPCAPFTRVGAVLLVRRERERERWRERKRAAITALPFLWENQTVHPEVKWDYFAMYFMHDCVLVFFSELIPCSTIRFLKFVNVSPQSKQHQRQSLFKNNRSKYPH